MKAVDPIALPANPALPLEAATKQYVDLNAFDVAPEAGRWVTVAGAGTTAGASAGWIYWLPVRCPACNINALGCDITTAGGAGSLVRLSIHKNHPTRIEPYELFYDAGAILDSSTTGWKETPTFGPVAWPGGWMWLGFTATVGGPTYRAVTGFGEPWIMFGVAQTPPNLTYRAWTVAVGSGALTATIPTLGVASQSNPKIAFKTA